MADEATAPAEWEEVDVGEADEVPEGGMTRFEAGDRAVVVFRIDGALHAYRDECPHQGASMSCGIISGAMLPTEPGGAPEFGLEGRVVVCPRHRWKFSIETGESLYAVDRRRLVPFPVRVEGDRLLIGVRRRAPSASADAA